MYYRVIEPREVHQRKKRLSTEHNSGRERVTPVVQVYRRYSIIQRAVLRNRGARSFVRLLSARLSLPLPACTSRIPLDEGCPDAI